TRPSPYCPAHPPALPSFPTRRSSDLDVNPGSQVSVSQPSLAGLQAALAAGTLSSAALTGFYLQRIERLNPALHAVITVNPNAPRSEEHTSELQSRGHLVCRLLLEKKK